MYKSKQILISKRKEPELYTYLENLGFLASVMTKGHKAKQNVKSNLPQGLRQISDVLRPIKPYQLIASKLIIIMVYTAISIIIGYICCSVYIIWVDRYFNLLKGTFTTSFLKAWTPMAITTVIVCTILSVWPFIIGMIRKSVPTTIVTSLLVIFIRQVVISKNVTNQESLPQILLVAIVTFSTALFIFKNKVSEL
ncbi:hypothetical protein M2145_000349 [Lachnospiraceae bacterium PF1-21]|uniref:ABC transporter permease n=1 Tax=Ohessyouella blattaphilus TaxID=2949333 RepID=A0ABT1EFG8_9FIRM|nr:hypothetical protein [Ohessyouella blattaphilus]MCP1109234.1 hypothetical protein [Ohessyouella blattaphilus]MCR8562628.1 hypothetical protein [Ohessyouella blattaphilus]